MATAPVILHEHPLSPYAQKVKIAMREKGVPFETRLPAVGPGADLGAFAALNPRLEVPAIEHEGGAIFDSTIILEYLDDRFPERPLLPRQPMARARARMVEELCDTYYEAVNWACMEIMVFRRAAGELAERLLATATRQRLGANTWLGRELGDRPWFGGDDFGWADAAVVPLLHAASLTGAPPAAGSPLATWLERARARSSVAATLAEAATAMEGFEQLPALVESGLFKREYRDHRLEWMLRSGGLDIVLDGLRRGNIRFSRELE